MNKDEALEKKAENARELGLNYEPVAWLTEERYAEIHTSKWSPKIKQIFSKEGVLESQTIQYTPQSIPVPYSPQRTWVGLTDEEVKNLCLSVGAEPIEVRLIEAKLKEKNT